jgi:hypothetical protein
MVAISRWVCFASSRAWSATCIASSRVGVRISRELAKHTHLDIATITGGVAYMNHAEVFSENQDIVVATTR